MFRKFKIILTLKYLIFKQSFNKNLKITTRIINILLGLFVLMQFIFIAFFFDKIIATFAQKVMHKDIIFQFTPIVIYLLFLFRILTSNKIDNTTLIIYRLGNDKKSTIFYHILFNIFNTYSNFLCLFFLIIGFKNFILNNSYFIFILYFFEVFFLILIFELSLLAYKEYYQKSHPKKFLFFVLLTGAIIYLTYKKSGFPIKISISTLLICLFLMFLFILLITIRSVKLSLFLDIEDSTIKVNKKTSFIYFKTNTLSALSLRYIQRSNKIFYQIVGLFILQIIVFISIILLKGNFERQSIIFSPILSSLFFIQGFSDLTFPQDYQWVGYLHSGCINFKKYIKNKLGIFQSINVVYLFIYSFIFIFTDIKWLYHTIIFTVFYSLTLPYLLSWIELQNYIPREPFSNSVFEPNPNGGYKFLFMIPIVPIPIIYLINTGFDIKNQIEYLQTNPNWYIHMLIICIVGFLLHKFWVKKLSQYYNKKRFEIFEKSELV